MKKFILLLTMSFYLTGCGCTVVNPGNRGVKVSLGEVSPQVLPEGLQWHAPMITSVEEVSVKQQSREMVAACYSADLQQVTAKLKVLYRIPEKNVVMLFQQYSGDPFDSLVAPRVQEALKEVTALESAESMVKKREQIKQQALEGAKRKIGDLIFIEDIVIENVDLSDDLEKAIEQKMVQEQEAAKAQFIKQKAQIDTETVIIKAEGEAKAIAIQGDAIRNNPKVLDLEMIKRWNGATPLVVGDSKGTSILLPLSKATDASRADTK